MSRVTLPTTRFTVEDYFRMAEADVFGSARVELINGRIYRMAPQRNPHMVAITRISKVLHRIVPATEWPIIQGTLRLDRHSAPDPDLLWLPVPEGTPEHKWPSPILLIEVSDTTYRKDSGIKLRKYAQAKIRDYWIVNLPADRIEVYRDPQNPTRRLADCRYASVAHFSRGESIVPLLRPEVQFAVNDLLPQSPQT
jgi:Uma2 family endonuclease